LSGADSATSCGVTFDIFSSDPATPLEITSIGTNPLTAGVSVTNDGLGPATDSTGPRVTWIGPIAGAAPDDTITATCAGVTDPVTLVVTLTEILAAA